MRFPSADQIIEVGKQLGMSLSQREAEDYLEAMAPLIDSYKTVNAMADEKPEIRYPRTPGIPPRPGENIHNAWYWRTAIAGAPGGKLAGQAVAIKDNI